MSETVQLWRCEVCGKWSHALRKPKSHERFVSEADVLDLPANVVREVEREYGHEGVDRPGGWMVACGPFVGWTAMREAA